MLFVGVAWFQEFEQLHRGICIDGCEEGGEDEGVVCFLGEAAEYFDCEVSLFFGEVREDCFCEAAIYQQFGAGCAVRICEDCFELGSYSFVADFFYFRCVFGDGLPCVWCDGEVELGAEPYCAEHSQVVFAEAFLRVADCSYDFLLQVFSAADEVDYFFLEWVVEHSVNCEVSSGGIIFGV